MLVNALSSTTTEMTQSIVKKSKLEVLTQVENKMIIRPTPTATAEQEEKQINNQSSTQNWLRKREVKGRKKREG